MKSAILLLLGVISQASAFQPSQTALAQLSSSSSNALVDSSDSDSDHDQALVQTTAEPCVYLDETQDELDY